VEFVAVLALARPAEIEAPFLAADLGLTAYETAIMLRGAMPVIVLRTDDRAKSIDILGKLRSRGHDAVACDTAQVISSEDMFRPKHFRIEEGALVATAHGETRRLAFSDIFALLRATHSVRVEESYIAKRQSVSVGRAAITGGLMTTKTTEAEAVRITTEREPVLYAFRSDSAPWLFPSQEMFYEGLGQQMKVSKTENFEVFIRVLRDYAPNVPYDTRLLQVRAPSTVVSPGARALTTSSAGHLDILAHIVALSLHRNTSAYR
jgi:hypothetical protein